MLIRRNELQEKFVIVVQHVQVGGKYLRDVPKDRDPGEWDTFRETPDSRQETGLGVKPIKNNSTLLALAIERWKSIGSAICIIHSTRRESTPRPYVAPSRSEAVHPTPA